MKGVPTTAGTHRLADNIATEDSTVVRKLAAAGMVLLGKTHTVQFAYRARASSRSRHAAQSLASGAACTRCSSAAVPWR